MKLKVGNTIRSRKYIDEKREAVQESIAQFDENEGDAFNGTDLNTLRKTNQNQLRHSKISTMIATMHRLENVQDRKMKGREMARTATVNTAMTIKVLYRTSLINYEIKKKLLLNNFNFLRDNIDLNINNLAGLLSFLCIFGDIFHTLDLLLLNFVVRFYLLHVLKKFVGPSFNLFIEFFLR